MTATRLLILLASAATLTCLTATGLALAWSADGAAFPASLTAAVSGIVALSSVVGVRARNRRDGTAITLFTM